MSDIRPPEEIARETERLAGRRYTIERQARIETLLWVLGEIENDRCPDGQPDDERIHELTDRGPWPFEPSVEVEQ